MGGLWGNHAYEAVYIMTYHDDQGDQLTGEHVYTLRLDPPPPVGAFWSLTMYDVPDFFLVANDINRYSIGDRTAGLVYADDGSLTITISHTKPGEAIAAANSPLTRPGLFPQTSAGSRASNGAALIFASSVRASSSAPAACSALSSRVASRRASCRGRRHCSAVQAANASS
jgi:Protein of unknown function (DUF1214)